MWLPVGHTFERNNTVDAIVKDSKYRNIRIMAGNSGAQSDGDFNPWMTALQSATDPEGGVNYPLFQFGAACWYFAQKLADQFEADGKPQIPIGLADTAVGGQRIEEYMDNTTISKCSDRLGEDIPQWDGVLFGKLVVPFLDMTVKGFVWYQGENNMGGTKGNAIANVGYGCEMVDLVQSWRTKWSLVPGTTDPDAPFGIVTLASSGSEGGPNMGAMRWSQTGNYGVLPNPLIPNSFLAQAYDLDDPWGPNEGPCIKEWQCCTVGNAHVTYNATACNLGTNNNPKMCDKACAAATGTEPVMGGIHPRDKKPVGDRLGLAAYNTIYGGTGPATGPTISGCEVQGDSLVVQFNQTLLRGDTVIIQPYNATLNMSYLEVMTDPTIFCVEVRKVNESCREHCDLYCPTWAGGSSITNNSALDGSDSQGWQPLNITLAGSSAVKADLTPLGSKPPVAVRYAWGLSECCDKSDPKLYVDYPCGPAPCPIMLGSKDFPANPFIAKINNGKCECIAPQTCDGTVG